MQTTVEINDALLAAAKDLARHDGVPLRAILESALRREIERRTDSQRFTLRDASFEGRGLQPGVAVGGWDALCETAYEGRGG